jgi:hypothetical protein
MRSERSARCGKQHVIVVGADERADGDETVAARTILDDHRLAPAPAQTVGDQPRADIDAAARSERHDELDRALRPCLRGRRLCREQKRGEQAEGECETLHAEYLRCRTILRIQSARYRNLQSVSTVAACCRAREVHPATPASRGPRCGDP